MSTYWSTDAHPEHDRFEPRKWLGRPKIHVDSTTRAITLDPKQCGVAVVSTDTVTIRLRRRGGRDCATWLLQYEHFDNDDRGNMRFIVDSKLFALPEGRYEAQVRQGETECGSFELVLDKTCALDVQSVATATGEDVKIINGDIDNVTDVFNAINTLDVQLCAVLEPTATVLPLSTTDRDALCAITLCRQVQLMLTDGVKSEVVGFSGCTNGVVEVVRGMEGTSVSRFPAGTSLSFTWTSANVTAAVEGCV